MRYTASETYTQNLAALLMQGVTALILMKAAADTYSTQQLEH